MTVETVRGSNEDQRSVTERLSDGWSGMKVSGDHQGKLVLVLIPDLR